MFGGDASDPKDGGQSGRKESGRVVREERRVAAWIGASVVVEGDLTSSEDMTVAGRVEGDVSVPQHTLVVAPGGTIRGDVVARAVLVHGTVKGSITADRRVEVGESGTVDGAVTAPRMMVAEGAVLHGRVGVAAS